VEVVLHQRADAGLLVHGEFRPGGQGREWCDPEVLRRLRQRSLAALRKEVEPAEAEALARFLPAWQGVGAEARGPDRLIEVIAQLQGVAIPASVLERDVLAARVADYSPRLLDDLAAAGQVVWVGAGPLGRDDGKVMLFLREEAAALRPERGSAGDRPDGPEHERLREVLARRGACFFSDLRSGDDKASLDALWDLVWAGEVTNDSFAALRAFTGTAGRTAAGARRPGGGGTRRRPNLGSLTVLGPPTAQGRWSLVEAELPAEGVSTTERARALAAALLERHGVVTREAVRGEGHPGGFASVYPVLRALEEAGRARRGYFVAGLGGAQFALPGAVDRLRTRQAPSGKQEVLVLAATDPANAYGIALPWPVAGSVPERRAGSVPERRGSPRRVAGAYVVLVDGAASLYLERGGRGLVALRPLDGTWEAAAIGALGALVEDGRLRRLAVERYDDGLAPALREAGFVPSPKGLVRYA
jgi:ATP-dependent Lhr-like helicase